MHRMRSEFYKELDALRAGFGETEYDRNDILPAVIGLLRKHGADDTSVWVDAAKSLLDSIEKSEESGEKPDLFGFNYDRHVPLGERNRIKRGAMNAFQISRRRRVVNANYIGQQNAWQAETQWLDRADDALRGRDATTKIKDVLPADVVAQPAE